MFWSFPPKKWDASNSFSKGYISICFTCEQFLVSGGQRRAFDVGPRRRLDDCDRRRFHRDRVRQAPSSRPLHPDLRVCRLDLDLRQVIPISTSLLNVRRNLLCWESVRFGVASEDWKNRTNPSWLVLGPPLSSTPSGISNSTLSFYGLRFLFWIVCKIWQGWWMVTGPVCPAEEKRRMIMRKMPNFVW